MKNVGPIRHCEPPYAHSPGVASGTVARRLRIVSTTSTTTTTTTTRDRGNRNSPMEWAQKETEGKIYSRGLNEYEYIMFHRHDFGGLRYFCLCGTEVNVLRNVLASYPSACRSGVSEVASGWYSSSSSSEVIISQDYTVGSEWSAFCCSTR